MRIRRTFPIALAVVVIAAAVTLAVQLRKHAPPEAARLLPGADAFFYLDLSWARRVNAGRELPAVSHDPEYERFIRETGIQFERDLDEAAFAVHYPAKWPGGGTGGAAPEPRFSEVLVGKFHGERLTIYLRQIAKSVENYHGVDIFTILLENRSLRVAVLNADSVAASNHDDAAVIRGMVDRSRRLASPFGGPALLRRYYKRVQLASPVWMVAHVDPSSPQFRGWNGVFDKPADIVVSASYNPLHLPLRTGALHVRAEAWVDSDEDARSVTDKLTTYLAMFHGAETSVGSPGNDPDLKALLDSLQVRQENTRAVLYAVLPTGVFRKLLQSSSQMPSADPPVELSQPAPSH